MKTEVVIKDHKRYGRLTPPLLVTALLLTGCSSDQKQPPMREDISLDLAGAATDEVAFKTLPKVSKQSSGSVEFSFISATNALLVATYIPGPHTPLTAEDILKKSAESDASLLLKQVGVMAGKTSTLTFWSPPRSEPLRFYFFLKDIHKKAMSKVEIVDLVLEDDLRPAKIKADTSVAYQGFPWEVKLDIQNDCFFYKLVKAPDWISIDQDKLVGTPGATARLGTFEFSLEGDQTKGCKGEQSFKVEVIGDPLFKNNWHMENRGQNAYAWFGATPGFDIRMNEANLLRLTGKGVHVRIADTGLQINHPDLIENILKDANTNIEAQNPDGCAVCDPFDTTPFLEEGTIGDKGTAVAGIIAARGWNGIGSRGVAPRASLSAINIQSIRMKPENVNLIDQLAGEYDILNQSWSKSDLQSERLPDLPFGYSDIQKDKVINGRKKLGSIIVKAAGDDHLDLGDANLDPYNNIPWQVVVGALDSNAQKASGSNTGSSLWITAPGGEAGYQSDYNLLKGKNIPRFKFQPALVSTDLFDPKAPCTTGYAKKASFFRSENEPVAPGFYNTGESSGFNMGWHKDNLNCAFAASLHGTSAATAVVSGAIALLLERNPKLGWRDVKHILALSARKIDPDFTERYTTLGKQRVVKTLPWIRNAAGYSFHNWYGFGAIDVSEAVKLAHPKLYKNLPEQVDSDWMAAFGGGGTIISQKPRGYESIFTSNLDKKVETVSVKIALSTPNVSKMGIELRSPAGTRSVLLPLNNGSLSKQVEEIILTTNAFYGEPAAGKWALQMLSNLPSGSDASVSSWSIRIIGH